MNTVYLKAISGRNNQKSLQKLGENHRAWVEAEVSESTNLQKCCIPRVKPILTGDNIKSFDKPEARSEKTGMLVSDGGRFSSRGCRRFRWRKRRPEREKPKGEEVNAPCCFCFKDIKAFKSIQNI